MVSLCDLYMEKRTCTRTHTQGLKRYTLLYIPTHLNKESTDSEYPPGKATQLTVNLEEDCQ